jgi:hypothetical protein
VLPTHRLATAAVALAAVLAAAPLAAQQPAYLARPQVVGGNPGPAHNYICPNVDGGPALECFLDAVRHLYTMCKHVKSIELIEHGFEKSEEGTNKNKSEFCVDKQKANISRPYQVALKEANGAGKQVVDNIRSLHDFWLASLTALKWVPGESPEDYHVRTGMIYPAIDVQVDAIRVLVSEARAQGASAAKAKARR